MQTFSGKNLKFKKTHVALAIALSLLGVQQTSAAFLDDSKSSINLRHAYIERDFEAENVANIGSWSQSAQGRFESGYTDTPIQIGLDLSAQYAVRLGDTNAERSDSIFLYNLQKQEQERDQLKLGATLKLKYGQTELKVGELLPMNPVAFIDNSRQLVTTFAGAMLESKEIKDLKISAGRITHVNARDDDSFEEIGLYDGKTRATITSDGLNFLGLDYNFTPSVSGAYWFGQMEDVYNQHYLNLAYATKVGDTNIKIDGRYFKYDDEGEAINGKIDNQSYGVMTTIENGNHLFMTGLRKNEGDGNLPTLTGHAPQPYLHAWSTLGFVKPEELTWHLWYTYNFKGLGINGLSATARYLYGTDIERKGIVDNKETEKSLALKYVVPEGKFKGIGLDWMHIRTDQKYGTGLAKGPEWSENRVILTYNYKF